jgi:glycosyltransferase involved in cell wall biosynthesis
MALIESPHFYFASSPMRNVQLFAKAQVSREPFRIAKARDPRMEELVRKWVASENYDAVHCDYLSTSPYRELCPDVPGVLTEHNVEWQTFTRLASYRSNPLVKAALNLDSKRTARWEARTLERFQHTLVLSHYDRDLLVRARPDLSERISVWPLPVTRHRISSGGGRAPLTVLVLGSLRSIGRLHGLRWFLSEVWKPLRARVPGAQLEIVGAEPPTDIATRDGQDGIHIHGFVEDLEPVLDRIDVCAIPLFVGAGIRVKVLELISRGVPCVGSTVALQGVDDIDGCITANERSEWIHTLTGMADDKTGPRQAAKRGADTLRSRHSPGRASEHLQRALSKVTRPVAQ